MNIFRQIGTFVRWRDWGPGKVTLLWGLCLYIAVAYNLAFESFFRTFTVFMVFAAMQSALGYVLNNWGDRELDRRQFKNNPFNGKPRLESYLELSLTIVLAFMTGLPLLLRPGFALLWLVWVLAAATYSLEPVRLKTKGLAGLVVAFVAQWFLPVLLAFAAFEVAGGVDMWVVAAALTISGATLEIGHQRMDRMRDLITRAGTFAASLSDQFIDRLYAAALVLDKLAIGLIMIVVVLALRESGTISATFLASFLALLYVALLLATLSRSVQSVQGMSLEDPYYSEGRTPGRMLHETLLNFFTPVALGIAAMLREPFYIVVLALFLVWRVVLGGADWRWPLRILGGWSD